MRWVGVTRRIGACGLILLLAGCDGMLLPSQSEIGSSTFTSYSSVHAAFDKISLKQTALSDLSGLGFDSQTTPNVAVMSYLDIVERFMPNSSMAFDKLDPAVQDCIMARTDCQGYVFKVEHHEFQRSGNLFLDLFGFLHTTTETGWTAQVLVLVQNGRVTHKLLSGEPNVQIVRDDIEPLGPMQNLGGMFAIAGSAAVRTIH
ncbi:MAG TPA: hypothetical protein VNU97_12545 [Rhizomicrobium sp.]|jgi:hypothetical protein|nr:hypothetical protein [Rhizomicrobium sp.]